ncbi:hypothetical protein SAMN04489732_1274 [Amycolatopsis saalfeldensis]|uniref:Uncharacterized protein n=1 Tax=Amycolatopsis saalfeldensis TaxID=394193 RepID=A0A1H8YMM5_9PSEU|nr:hypothetical protein SAMN04489732_1274 [Amycolatopsis saalfeldensis]
MAPVGRRGGARTTGELGKPPDPVAGFTLRRRPPDPAVFVGAGCDGEAVDAVDALSDEKNPDRPRRARPSRAVGCVLAAVLLLATVIWVTSGSPGKGESAASPEITRPGNRSVPVVSPFGGAPVPAARPGVCPVQGIAQPAGGPVRLVDRLYLGGRRGDRLVSGIARPGGCPASRIARPGGCPVSRIVWSGGGSVPVIVRLVDRVFLGGQRGDLLVSGIAGPGSCPVPRIAWPAGGSAPAIVQPADRPVPRGQPGDRLVSKIPRSGSCPAPRITQPDGRPVPPIAQPGARPTPAIVQRSDRPIPAIAKGRLPAPSAGLRRAAGRSPPSFEEPGELG